MSPVKATVRANQAMEVVHLQSLQTWIADTQPTPTAVLQQLGLVSERADTVNVAKYKVTIFDVESTSLCRPIQIAEGGPTEIEGLSVCSVTTTKPASRYMRHGFTGCGYTKNPLTQERGFDVYRVDWQDASKWGFCVLPLERFLLGAPQ